MVPDRTIRLGSFDAEAYWRPKHLARLPGVELKRSRDLIATMDELLFPWQGSADLVTLLPLAAAQFAYLTGLQPASNHISVFSSAEEWLTAGSPMCVFTAIRQRSDIVARMKGCVLDPYAVLPACMRLAEDIGSSSSWPPQHVVADVNSKLFSAELTRQYCPGVQIAVLRSTRGLRQFVQQQAGAVLVKDPFGVSGKGQYLIQTPLDLDRLEEHLRLQERRGYLLEFVMESFTPFLLEFGNYFYLHADGAVEARGARVTLNRGSRYAGSAGPDPETVRRIADFQHQKILESFLAELSRAGYYGPVCFDSALLADNTLRSVLEINARQSMGSLSFAFDEVLAQRYGLLSFWKVLETRDLSRFSYAEILERMNTMKFLWFPERSAGIVPLTSRSLNPQDETPGVSFTMRRWFYAVAASTLELAADVERRFLAWIESGLEVHCS